MITVITDSSSERAWMMEVLRAGELNISHEQLQYLVDHGVSTAQNVKYVCSDNYVDDMKWTEEERAEIEQAKKEKATEEA